MKKYYNKYVGVVLVFVMLFSVGVFAGESDYGAKGASEKESFTVEEMLTYALEDEYLAKAEYEKIIEEYDVQRPFSQIIKSEEQHISILIPLFEAYDIALVEDSASEHVYVPDSLNEAFEIGVQAEIDNIAMYEKFLEQELPDDLASAFERLKNASENHLSAFEKGLDRETGDGAKRGGFGRTRNNGQQNRR